MRSLLRSIVRTVTKRRVDKLGDTGFHGDTHLIALTDHLLEQASSFIETGTNVGTTTLHVARRNPDLQCISCEPWQPAYEAAARHAYPYANARIYNMDSISLLDMMADQWPAGPRVWWLDAHGWGFKWPLRAEVAEISANAVNEAMLIDDFQVPGLPEFGYEEYGTQVCSWDYIAPALARNPDAVYYPAYTERTSPHHPLRGWVLMLFGNGFSVEGCATSVRTATPALPNSL